MTTRKQQKLEANPQRIRKRKVHVKSRRGCRNCKLRSVKCDECQPHCTKCTTYGVLCNYDPKIGDLQMLISSDLACNVDWNLSPVRMSDEVIPQKALIRRVEAQKLPVSHPIEEIPAITNMLFLYPSITDELTSSTFELSNSSLSALDRFMKRTVLTIGPGKGAAHYQKVILKLALDSPYLMHMVMAFTAVHDQYLESAFTPQRQSLPDVYNHWNIAASQFNSALSLPAHLLSRDALWATTVLIALLAAAAISANTPFEAWPLKPSDASDLDWLRMAEGKKAIWKLVNPLREDSAFLPLKTLFEDGGVPEPKPLIGIVSVPMAFRKLFEIDENSTVENNVYLNPVQCIMSLLPLQPNKNTVVHFFAFVAHMRPAFKKLMEAKDPRALLLMAHWYAKVSDTTQWWIVRRAVLEGTATCLYLEQYHSDDKAIQDLLGYPRRHFGLADAEGDYMDIRPPYGNQAPLCYVEESCT